MVCAVIIYKLSKEDLPILKIKQVLVYQVIEYFTLEERIKREILDHQ